MASNVRLSPGVYRTASGQMTHSSRPVASKTAQRKGLLAPVVQNAPQSITQTSPFGTANYNYDANGNITQNVTLSPTEQAKLDAQNQQQIQQAQLGSQLFGNVQNAYSQPFNPALGAAPDYSQLNPANFKDQRQQVQDDLYSQYTRRLDPQWQREEEQLSQSLANRGIPVGSELYNQQMQQFRQSKNDSYLDANSQAIQAGGQEQSRLFGMTGDALNAQLYGRNAALQEAQTFRDRPLAEYQGVMQGFGVNAPNQESAASLQAGTLGQQGQNLATAQFLKKPTGGGGGGGGGRAGGGGGGQPMMQMPTFSMPQQQPTPQPSMWGQLGQGLLQGFTAGAVGGLFGGGGFGRGNSIFG